MRKRQMTWSRQKHVGGLVRTIYYHVTTNFIRYILARNSTIQRTGESFQVQGLTITTHLSQDSPEPSHHKGGWVWVSLFLLTPKAWSFHQPSNSQHPTGHPLSFDFWYCVCGVRAEATGSGIKTALTIDASHVFSSYHVSEQVTENWNFHSTSILKNSIKLVNKLRKTLNPCSESKVQEKKIRNCEMEEIFRTWV